MNSIGVIRDGVVAAAEKDGIGLDAISDAAVASALAGSDAPTAAALASEPGVGDELRAAASIDGALASCDVIGGTAPARVAAALTAARERLDRA